jgi:hypothetical protein
MNFSEMRQKCNVLCCIMDTKSDHIFVGKKCYNHTCESESRLKIVEEIFSQKIISSTVMMMIDQHCRPGQQYSQSRTHN